MERARSPSPVCHERMEPSRSPSVPRGQERFPGVDTLLVERGLSDDDVIGYDEFPKGFSGSSPEQSCDDDKLLASPPRPPLTPLLVDSPKDNPGRIGIVHHREEAGLARALPPMMVSPVGLGQAIRVLLWPLVMRTVVGCDVPGVRRCPPVDSEGSQRVKEDHAQDMNPVLWNPSTRPPGKPFKPFFFRQKPFFPNFCKKPFLAFFPGASKIALKYPSRSLFLKKIPRGGPPDPHLWHGEPFHTLHIQHFAARHIILQHFVPHKNFPEQKLKKHKNTNL